MITLMSVRTLNLYGGNTFADYQRFRGPGIRAVPGDEVTVKINHELVELTDHRPVEIGVDERTLAG